MGRGGVEKPPMTISECPDRAIAYAERKKRARETKTSVVKCALSSRVHDSVRDRFIPVIESTILYVSMTCFRGSRILNHIAVCRLTDHEPLPDITRDSYLDAIIRGDRTYDDIAASLTSGMGGIPSQFAMRMSLLS
jgi:hypothetical protein